MRTVAAAVDRRLASPAAALVTFGAVAAGIALALAAGGCRRAEAPAADATAGPKPPVEARSEVDRAVATTGDVITYRVTVDHDPAYAVELPEPGADIAGFRVIDLGREKPRTENGRVVEERWYKLRADLVGSYVLPPVTVSYRPIAEGAGEPAVQGSGGASPAGNPSDQTSGGGLSAGQSVDNDSGGGESPAGKSADRDSGGASGADGHLSKAAADGHSTLETSEIFVEVESVLPADGTASDIHDIKPLERVRERPPWLVPAAVAAALAVLAGAALWWWRRRGSAPAAPPRPAHEIAFAALDDLRRTDFADLAAVRRYYFAISEVIRTYVEARFGLNATDLTSEEIRAALPRVSGLDAGEAKRLTGFLTATDRVKFAARVPTEAEIGEVYEDALSFVEATRPLPVPAATAEDGAAGGGAPPAPSTTEPIAAAGGA